MKVSNMYKYEEVKQDAIDKLKDGIGMDCYACDLHHELFNTDYYIIGTYQAKQWLGNEAFDIIGIIQEYEQDNFGEVNTDLADPEKVVNMYVYILGEYILQESDTLSNKWNSMLEQEDIDNIIDELN